LQVLTTPSYHTAAAKISAKLQTHAAFRTPIQRAADEVLVLLAGSTAHNSLPAKQQSHTQEL
jgi:hypothetical protein